MVFQYLDLDLYFLPSRSGEASLTPKTKIKLVLKLSEFGYYEEYCGPIDSFQFNVGAENIMSMVVMIG